MVRSKMSHIMASLLCRYNILYYDKGEIISTRKNDPDSKEK